MITQEIVNAAILHLGRCKSARTIAEQMLLVSHGSIETCLRAYEQELGAQVTLHNIIQAKRTQDEAAARAAETARGESVTIRAYPSVYAAEPSVYADVLSSDDVVKANDAPEAEDAEDRADAEAAFVSAMWPTLGDISTYHLPKEYPHARG